MGWFLHKTSATKRKRTSYASASGSSSGGTWDPQRTLLGLKALGVVAIVVGTILGYRGLETSLSQYASRTQAATPRTQQVELVDAPAWLSPSVAMRLKSVIAERIGRNPMNAASLRIAAKVLVRDPWIKRVQQIRRRPGGKIRVKAEYRQPVAMIETPQGYYLVDGQGVWLPTNEASHRALPTITGVIQGVLPTAPGRAWTGLDVAAALELAQTLRDEPYMNQVTAIDASGRDRMGRVQLVLYTDRSWIVWGLPPGDERSVEPGVSVKLRRLREVARASTIDAAGRGLYLNRATIMTARADSLRRY